MTGVVTAEEGRAWRWCQRAAMTFTVGGGAVMLAIAAFAHDVSAIPLVVIGGSWLAMGVAAVHLDRNLARSVRLDGDSVVFVSRKTVAVPVADITEVRRRRGDLNRNGPVLFITATHGTLRTSGRLRGLIELVAELRRANPTIKLNDL
ncbi:MAG TPA: hypothetical protein VGL05_15015 [Kribbella sp.]